MHDLAATPSSQHPFPVAGDEVWGVVVEIQANYYRVRLNFGLSPETAGMPGEIALELSGGTDLLCYRRSRLKKIGQQVMVGDWVRVEDPDWAGGRGAIAAIRSRQTVLDRPPVANADQVLLMFALAEPDLDPQQLSRFLVKAESTQLQVSLCLNKKDLVSAQQCEYWRYRLHLWGYDPKLVSIKSAVSVEDLLQTLRSHITVVSGPSGVGKSSLINQLIPQADLRTSAVSGKLGRGRHTTRHVELFELPKGGFLADTPGFNQPDLDLDPTQLGECFPEIRQRLAEQQCQFNDCLHRDEPGCAVGHDWDRYEFYLALLDELMGQQESAYQRRDEENTFKIKVGEAGQIQHEPKLQAKKYRRVSRKSRKQSLHELRYDLPESVDELEDMEDFEADWD
jgi:ribosome biogenesis GTPase